MTRQTVSLVLGSGGARGLAHIGVIEWLNRNDYDIRSIAGSSMGALIGGIYAAGELDAYRRWVTMLERIDVVRLMDLTFRQPGLFKGERIMKVLKELIGDHDIESLPISFTAVATDVDNQKEVWLNHGPLFDAIRASIAIPTIFTPFVYHGKRLVDGGLINPIPIAPTLKDKTDLTIAVNLGARPEARLEQLEKHIHGVSSSDRYRKLIVQFIDNLQQKVVRREAQDMGFFDVVSKSFETMQNTIARFKLAAHAPDVIIDIPRNASAFYEFHKAEYLIEVGMIKADEVLGKRG